MRNAAVNTVGQAMVFAQHLEETGAGIFSQNSIEHAQGKAPFIMPRANPEPERELQLGCLLLHETHPRPGLLAPGLLELWAFSGWKTGSQLLHSADNTRVLDVSGNGDYER